MDCQLNVLIKNWFGISLGTERGNDMEKINVKDQKMVYTTNLVSNNRTNQKSHSIDMSSIQIDA